MLLRSQKLREHEVSVTEVVAALRAQNTTAPVGKVRGELEDQVSGWSTPRIAGRVRPVSSSSAAARVVRLAQVALVQDGFAELSTVSMRSGHPNVGLAITRTREASTVSVADGIRKVVAEIGATLPQGTKLEVTRDGGVDAQNSLNNVIHALLFGAVLTIFVVYIFLNSWRSTMITALSLPTSVIAAFIAVGWPAHAQFMSLLGLSLAIGVLIGRRHRGAREHCSPHGDGRRPTHRGTQRTSEIGLQLRPTTFSIVAVFIPGAFMPAYRANGSGHSASRGGVGAGQLFISFTLDRCCLPYGRPPGHHLARKTGISLVLHGFQTSGRPQADRYGR